MIDIEHIKKDPSNADWDYICKNIEFNDSTYSFICENHLNISWNKLLLYNKNISSYIVNFFGIGTTCWNIISQNKNLSEDFIREFADKVNWNYISQLKLSIDFIKEFENKINWGQLSLSDNLSEDIISEFANEIDWYYISKYQKLSKEFIAKYINNLYLEQIIYYNLQVSEETIKYIKMFI